MARYIRNAMNHMRSPLAGVRQGGPASIIKSIQSGTIAIGSGSASNTATINAVVTANSLLFWNGSYDATATTNQDMIADVVLTNTTTITATRSNAGTNTCNARYTIIEFIPGVLTSVQRGTITIASGSTSNTATITSVSENVAFFNCLGYRNTNNSAERIDSAFATITLTDATTVTASRTTNDSFNTIVGYQVAEFSTQYIYRTAKVNAALSASSGMLTLTGALGTAISSFPQGGVPLIGWAGFKTAGSTIADGFFSPSLEFQIDTTFKMFHVRDVTGSSTSGTNSLSIVFFKPEYARYSQLITIPMVTANSATDTMPVNSVAGKTFVGLSGYRTTGSCGAGSAGSLQRLIGAVANDNTNIYCNRGSTTENCYVQANVVEFK